MTLTFEPCAAAACSKQKPAVNKGGKADYVQRITSEKCCSWEHCRNGKIWVSWSKTLVTEKRTKWAGQRRTSPTEDGGFMNERAAAHTDPYLTGFDRVPKIETIARLLTEKVILFLSCARTHTVLLSPRPSRPPPSVSHRRTLTISVPPRSRTQQSWWPWSLH